jgi:hypothetical protein
MVAFRRVASLAASLAIASLIAGSDAAAAVATAPAALNPLPDGGVTAAEMVNILQDKGYRAKLSKDEEGDPKIESATQGYNFSVYFYGCQKAPRCSSIQFYAGWHIAAGFKIEDANTWNRSKRFGRAYVDKEHDPNVEMDVDVEHGATSEAIANDLDTWDLVVANFSSWIDCVDKPATDACHKDFS